MSNPNVVRDSDGDLWYWAGTEYHCAADEYEWDPQASYEELDDAYGPLEIVVTSDGNRHGTKSQRLAALEGFRQHAEHRLENLDQTVEAANKIRETQTRTMWDAHKQLKAEIERWTPLGPAVFDSSRAKSLDDGVHVKRPLPANLLDRLDELERTNTESAFRKRVTSIITDWAEHGPGAVSALKQPVFLAERVPGARPGQTRSLPADLLDRFDQLKDTVDQLRTQLRTLKEFQEEHATVHAALDEDIDDIQIDTRKLKVAYGPDNLEEQTVIVERWGNWTPLPGTGLEIKISLATRPVGTKVHLRKARD